MRRNSLKCTGFRRPDYAEALEKKQAQDARRREDLLNAPQTSRKPRQANALPQGIPPRKAPRQRQPIGNKPPAPGTVRDLERQLDDLVRKVLHREQSICFTDGRPATVNDPLEVSHLFGRVKRSTRFDVHPGGNNSLQHRSCNAAHNNDKSIYRNAYIKVYGQDEYDELERRSNQSQPFDYVTLLKMIEQRKSML